MAFKLNEAQVAEFKKNGYLIVREFLTTDETAKLLEVALEDSVMSKNSYDLNDHSGKKTKLGLWFTPGNDTYGLLTKSERMVNSVHQLLDGEAPVCHFHSKLMQKEPKLAVRGNGIRIMVIGLK